MPEEQYQDLGVQYHVLPAHDPLHALNILREAAGLDPLSMNDRNFVRSSGSGAGNSSNWSPSRNSSPRLSTSRSGSNESAGGLLRSNRYRAARPSRAWHFVARFCAGSA